MNEKYLKTKEGSIEDVAKQMQNKVMENDYQDKFKKALDKEGKPLGHMTGAEKKSFFNKVDKMHKGNNEEKEIPKGYHKMPDGTIMKDSEHKKEVKEARWEIEGTMGYKGISGTDGFHMVIDAPSESAAEDKAYDELDKARSKRKLGPGGGGRIEDAEVISVERTSSRLQSPTQTHLSHTQIEGKPISERGGANTSSKQGSFAKSKKAKYRFGYRVAEKDPSVKEQVNETHTTQTAKANAHQRSAGGEKSPISHMVNKSIKEITANDGKTFAQMRAEMDEACWDSHKQVGTKMKGGKQVPNCVPKNEDTSYPSKDDKIKGANPADKGEKEQQAGEDTRDPKKKTMSGQVATSPEMNPKVDYKY